MNAPTECRTLLSAMDDRIEMLEAQLNCATSGEQQVIARDLKICKSLRRQMIRNWKKHRAPAFEASYSGTTLH